MPAAGAPRAASERASAKSPRPEKRMNTPTITTSQFTNIPGQNQRIAPKTSSTRPTKRSDCVETSRARA